MTDSRAVVASLSLKDFRNFERLALEIPAEGLALVGDNGHGKTNLLEAVGYLSLLRSVRGARDADVARFGADGFFLDAKLRAPREHHLAIGFERQSRRKRVRLDETPVDRFSDALGVLPTVMFSPSDVELVAGAPGTRRRYLDVMLALTSRGYLKALQQYRGALERRNAALRSAQRSGGRGADAIVVWEAPLAEHGAVLVRARRAWSSANAARFGERCSAIGERAEVTLRYHASVKDASDDVAARLEAELATRRDADLRFGLTQIGPHRDDLSLLISGRELKEFGSSGQQRTAAIALRLLEAETLRDARLTSPVFLLDDPFAELDETRSARVLGLLGEVGLGQALLAVPRESEIPRALTSLQVRQVRDGRIMS